MRNFVFTVTRKQEEYTGLEMPDVQTMTVNMKGDFTGAEVVKIADLLNELSQGKLYKDFKNILPEPDEPPKLPRPQITKADLPWILVIAIILAGAFFYEIYK